MPGNTKQRRERRRARGRSAGSSRAPSTKGSRSKQPVLKTVPRFAPETPRPVAGPATRSQATRKAPRLQQLVSQATANAKTRNHSIGSAYMTEVLLGVNRLNLPLVMPRQANPSALAYHKGDSSASISISDYAAVQAVIESDTNNIPTFENGGRVWNMYAITQVSDPGIYAILPSKPSASRVFRCRLSFLPAATLVDVSLTTLTYEQTAVFMSLPTTTAGGIQTALCRRPIEMPIGGGTGSVWVDANPNAPATFAFTSSYVITAAGGGGTVGFYYDLMLHTGPDRVPGMASSVQLVSQILNAGTNTYALTGNCLVKHSGHYSVRTRILAAGTSVTSISENGFTSLDITEQTSLCTTYFINPVHTDRAAALFSRSWTVGQTLLVSSRSAPLTTRGVLLGMAAETTYGYYPVASSLASTVHDEVEARYTFNEHAGGEAVKGIYTYARNPVSNQVARAIAPYDQSLSYYARHAVAYTLPSDQDTPGINVILPTVVAADPGWIYRLSGSCVVAYCATTDLVPGRTPSLLTADEWGNVVQALAAIPRFTENDFHDKLRVAGENVLATIDFFTKVGKGVYKAHQFAKMLGTIPYPSLAL